jgi:hypothetical protein
MSKNVSNSSTSCKYNLDNSELQCYKNNYPDLKGKTDSELQYEWSTTGCKEKRNNQCPSYQINSGLYNYKGCFNNICSEDKGLDSIPNNQGIVDSIDQCQEIASNNKQNVFGLQVNKSNNTECWTGDNIENAYKYKQNFSRYDCKPLGTKCTQQVYAKEESLYPPSQLMPKLTDANFSNNIESFENRDNNKFLILFILFIIILLFFYKKFY